MERNFEGRVLILADTHLTRRFNKKKLDLLVRLIKDADRVIINGDFYESYVTSFEQFITSPWKALFPYLKEKGTVCITGNHDSDLGRHKYQLFCDEVTEQFSFTQNGIRFHLVHGHSTNFFTKRVLRYMPRFVMAAISEFAKAACVILGPEHLRIYKSQNSRLKRWKISEYPADDWLICAHTHFAEVDKKIRFANPGLFLNDYIASYLIVEDGAVKVQYAWK